MSIPAELKYTKEHEWAKIEDDTVTIGITHFAQDQLGDVVFVELPEVGDDLTADATFGSIEAVKAVSDLYAPISGEVIAINEDLENDPASVNNDPYGKGWMIKVKFSNPSELAHLLSNTDYEKVIG